MKHHLLRPRPAIEHRSIVAIPQLLHHPFCNQEHPPNQFPISLFNVVERRDYSLRDDQHVNRRPRADVVDHDILIVLVRDLRRNLPRDDLLEQCLLSHSHSI